MRFDLWNDRLPLFTTKQVVWESMWEELRWFISGSTNASTWRTKIWKKNLSRKALDRAAFPDREEGDLGPGYGPQWRHSVVPYRDMHSDYQGQGVDQLGQVLEKLKQRSSSRRLIVCSGLPSTAASLGRRPLP